MVIERTFPIMKYLRVQNNSRQKHCREMQMTQDVIGFSFASDRLVCKLLRKFQYQKTMLNKQHGIFLDSPLNKLSDTLFTLTTFRMLSILLVNRLRKRRLSFTWSQCRMHMNSMCPRSPGIASAMDLGFISVMRNLITFSSSSPENSIIPRFLCCLNCGRGGRGSYQSEHKNRSIIICLQMWL